MVAERSIGSSVSRVSEMFVKSQTNTSFCFSDVCVARFLLFTEIADDLIHHIFSVAPATQSVHASCTFATPAGAGGRVQG